MKIKKLLLLFILCIASICLFSLATTVNAATISDDGKCTVVFHTDTGDINGESHQAVKFDFADGEETVQLSDISKDINPFSGYEFLGWTVFTSTGFKPVTEIAKSDFTGYGYIEVDGTRYDNAIMVDASYDTSKPIKNSGTYYITLDGFAGKINGKSTLKIEQKSSEFKTVDLTQYTAVRDDCIFVGWDYNGSIVKSISEDAFSNGDAITVQAVYKATKNPSDITADDYVLKLDANGGKIDGQDSNLYYYLGGKDSGTSMSLLPYIPTRNGYTFAGWNTEADGTGNNKKYIFWRDWNGGRGVENAITLYATWTKNSETPTTPETPQEPAKDTVKVVESSSTTKGNIEFETEVNKDYVLDIKITEVKKKLADKNVKFIADINVLEDGQVVKISDTKIKIKIALPDDLKGYNKYEVVYILNGEIKETIPATVEDGYIVFETSHLSEYGIVATNVEENNKTENTVINNPKTGDNIIIFSIIFVIALTGILATCIIIRKRVKNNK